MNIKCSMAPCDVVLSIFLLCSYTVSTANYVYEEIGVGTITNLSSSTPLCYKYNNTVSKYVLVFHIDVSSGDADLFVRFGSEATTAVFDCSPYKAGTISETCNMWPAHIGVYYLMLDAFAPFSGVTLTVERANLTTMAPTDDPTVDPTTMAPTDDPTVDPTDDPSHDPTHDPTMNPVRDKQVIQDTQTTKLTRDCMECEDGNDDASNETPLWYDYVDYNIIVVGACACVVVCVCCIVCVCCYLFGSRNSKAKENEDNITGIVSEDGADSSIAVQGRPGAAVNMVQAKNEINLATTNSEVESDDNDSIDDDDDDDDDAEDLYKPGIEQSVEEKETNGATDNVDKMEATDERDGGENMNEEGLTAGARIQTDGNV